VPYFEDDFSGFIVYLLVLLMSLPFTLLKTLLVLYNLCLDKYLCATIKETKGGTGLSVFFDILKSLKSLTHLM